MTEGQAIRGPVVIERVPRLALTPVEAAACLGVSRDFFDQHVQPELRIVRRGRRRLIPTCELNRWLDTSASLALADELDRRQAAAG